MMLEVSGISAGYGDLQILDEITFQIEEGDVVSLIGPNGAGKTTLMRTVIGELSPTRGEIRLGGTDITEISTDKRIKRGLSLVPEERHLFRTMTVKENLILGSYTSQNSDRDKRLRRVFDLFPRLEERIDQHAGTLSGGEAQMLTIGRALMADPDVLLLDEPSVGLAPKLIPDLFDKIREINQSGVTILIVEQRVRQALEVADEGHLLEEGQITVSGSAKELLADESVIQKYLGGT